MVAREVWVGGPAVGERPEADVGVVQEGAWWEQHQGTSGNHIGARPTSKQRRSTRVWQQPSQLDVAAAEHLTPLPENCTLIPDR